MKLTKDGMYFHGNRSEARKRSTTPIQKNRSIFLISAFVSGVLNRMRRIRHSSKSGSPIEQLSFLMMLLFAIMSRIATDMLCIVLPLVIRIRPDNICSSSGSQKTQDKPATKADAKSDAKADGKADAKADAKADDKAADPKEGEAPIPTLPRA